MSSFTGPDPGISLKNTLQILLVKVNIMERFAAKTDPGRI
jgi:hypothetical protein